MPAFIDYLLPEFCVIRRVGIALLGLLGLVIVAVIVAIMFVAQVDMRSRVESLASGRLGRPVKIEGLSIRWANPLGLEMTGLHVANPAWGRTPDMVSIARMHAEVALWPLLHGEIRLSKVATERPVIVLERDPGGTGNWVLPGLGASPSGVGKPPTALPNVVVFDMVMKEGGLTFRTSSGHVLRVQVAEANLTAADANSPILLQAKGSYNDLPLTASMTLESFAALQRVPRPVATEIIATSRGSSTATRSTAASAMRSRSRRRIRCRRSRSRRTSRKASRTGTGLRGRSRLARWRSVLWRRTS